ncbi:MAG TPA: cupin domain-containing protein [Candidatus Binatia bacterium]|nr:cupin domain-containing protein [Candidatus Binatia bacterium]
MPTLLHSTEVPRMPSGSVRFEGKEYKSGISFFLISDAPGRPGPPLHKHPYSETWILRSGKAFFKAGDLEVEATSGDILVTEPDTPHKYRNIGDTNLDLICIHDSPIMIQENLE